MNYRFRTMDGMRGVAAMIVVLGHAPEFFALGYIPHFWLSVDLFFLMSGFVLGRTYEPRFTSGFGASEFIVNRYIRLYPLYALGIVIGILSGGVTMLAGKGSLDAGNFAIAAVSGLLLLPAPTFGQSELFPLDFPAWSLFLEICINIVFALLRNKLSDHLIIIFVIALAALLFCYSPGGEIFGGTTWATLQWGVARIGFSFFLGVLMQRHHPGARWHSDAAYLVPITTITLLCVPIVADEGTFDVVQVVFVFPMLLWLAGLVEPRHGRMMTALGVSSYPIYVLHVPVLSVLWRGLLVFKMRPETFAPLLGVALLLGLFALGLILDRYYDAPVRRHLAARFAIRPRRDRRFTLIDPPF